MLGCRWVGSFLRGKISWPKVRYPGAVRSNRAGVMFKSTIDGFSLHASLRKSEAALLANAGFGLAKVVLTASPYSIVEDVLGDYYCAG